MSNSQNLPHKTPQWVWYSLIPTFGSLAIVYAGNKSKTPKWIGYGLGFLTFSILLPSSEIVAIIWLVQIATAFSLKNSYLRKTNSKGRPIDSREIAKEIAQEQGQIDINNCTQDELVHTIGLPIVYANDILSLTQEGYMFTHIEELSEVAGIPGSYLRKIEPLITFSYDINKEVDNSWRRLNSLSLEELVALDIDASAAQKIVTERTKGTYKSLIDVRKRTGVPVSVYQHLV